MDKMKNYYAILGVHRQAHYLEIKEAWKQKARIHHPDKGGSHVAMAEVNEAYRVLTNKAERAQWSALYGAKAFTCPTCDGKGTHRKQKSFGKAEVGVCKSCEGAGVIRKE